VSAAPAAADKPLREPNVIPPALFPAGIACAGFTVEIVADVNAQTVTTFFDSEGNPVRLLITGRLILTVTNTDTGEAVTIRLGDAIHITFNADGSVTLVGTGNVLSIFFPTDFPPGPSTTLYSGRLVIPITAAGVGTLETATGKAIDICAVLAP
jgi:hypothetical protein